MKAWLVVGLLAMPACAACIDFVPIPAGEFVMGNTQFDEAVFELPDGAHMISISMIRKAAFLRGEFQQPANGQSGLNPGQNGFFSSAVNLEMGAKTGSVAGPWHRCGA